MPAARPATLAALLALLAWPALANPAKAPAAAKTPAPAKKEVPCPLLSKEEANALSGGAVARVKVENGEDLTTCVFNDSRGFEVMSLNVQPALPDPKTFLENTKKWFAKIYPKDPLVPLADLGEAYWAPKPGHVVAVKGDRSLVAKSRPKSGGLSAAKEPSEALARKVVPRLK